MRTTSRAHVKAMAVLGLAMLCAACNLLPGSDSPTTTTTMTDTWSNTLAVKGASFYTFTVASAGTAAVGLGVGTPNASSGCALTSSTTSAVASSTPQISVTENPGSYCIQIFDVGNLTAPSTFTISIAHP